MGRFGSLLGFWGNDGHITGYLGIEWVLCWVFGGQGGHNTGNLPTWWVLGSVLWAGWVYYWVFVGRLDSLLVFWGAGLRY